MFPVEDKIFCLSLVRIDHSDNLDLIRCDPNFRVFRQSPWTCTSWKILI